MENNENKPATFHPLDVQATGVDLLDLNEMVKAGASSGWPIDGDARNRGLAAVMVREIQMIVGIEPVPFQRAYMNAETVAIPDDQGVTITRRDNV